jgi:hypothetical protein
MRGVRVSFLGAAAIAAVLVFASAAAASTNLNLLPGTAVLLSKSGSGPLSSTSSSTNSFSPAAYADYKHFGGEPTVVVDRYLVTTGTINGKACSSASPCHPDYAYACSPQGFVEPHYSTFLKSSDLGQTFRVTNHFPATDEEQFNAGGGGDCHIAVGQVSHKVFFTDLPAACVTLNVSSDFGESFVPGPQACGTTPGAVDDRNWVAVDELAPGDAPPLTGHVYVSFINFTNGAAPTLEAQVSDDDGNDATAGFATSPCNAATIATGSVPVTGGVQAPDSTATPCPDPADSFLDVAGPPVVDPNTHNVYLPFIRATPVIPDVSSGPPFSLYIAKSTDLGQSWTRIKVADLGTHDPVNIFPELTSDTAGNLYYTWSQTQAPSEAAPGLGGEQDVYYSFSTNQGTTWANPIDLTKEPGDSAVFPWMVAGSPGEVDLAFYKSNTGLNSNVAEVDTNGNPCDSSTQTCAGPNPSVWNVYFSSSQNALNTGPNFKTVQISSQPNHLGQVCTAGLGCSTGGNRNLLDFFTVDLDHLGAANVVWADDNNSNSLTINRFSRQLSGASAFKNTNISLASSWPITDHAVTDPSGDVADGNGVLKGTCPGIDLLGTSEQASNGLLTVTLTLNNAPTAAEATSCSALSGTTGGVWGAEFWSSSSAGSDNFYLAYRDNPPDGTPRGEAGRVDHLNATVTSADFDPSQPATVGGTCFTSGGSPTNKSPCTVILTTSLSPLGVKPGAGLYSITGLSTYQFGTVTPAPFTNLNLGNNEQADAATAFDDNGTGTTK